MRRKAVCILLFVVMVAGIFQVPVFAGTESTDNMEGLSLIPDEETTLDIPTMTVGNAIEEIDVSKYVTGGIAPYQYSSEGLPEGITINENTGIISGTPASTGSEGTATIVVTDSGSPAAIASYEIHYGATEPSAPEPSQTDGSQEVVDQAVTAENTTNTLNLGGYDAIFNSPVYEDSRLPTNAKPDRLRLTARIDGSIYLDWTDCVSLGADIDGYILLKRTGNKGEFKEIVKRGSGKFNHADFRVEKNILYSYMVLGYKIDENGNLTVSNASPTVVGVTANSLKYNGYTPTINRTSATVIVGQKLQLSLAYPSNSVSTWTRWRSENTSIATVNSTGLVTAISPGTVAIIGKTPNGRDIKCTVTVKTNLTDGEKSSKSFAFGGNSTNFREAVYEKLRLPSVARPYNLRLTARADSSLMLEWNDCVKLGADIDGYMILKKTGSGAYVDYTRAATWKTYYIDRNVSRNVNYSYIVVGYKKDDKGTIMPSNPSMSVVGVTIKSTKFNTYTPTINKTSATIAVGQTFQLTLKYPTGSLSSWTRWRSHNSKVATVNSSGIVRGISPGTALISGRTPNGRDIRCTVIVKTIPKANIYSTVTTPLQLTSKSTITLTGTIKNSNTKRLSIAIDDKYYSGISSYAGTWKYTIDLTKLSTGWHYIYFVPQDKANYKQTVKGEGVFVNKPAGGKAMMIVPESLVKQGRIENNDKKTGYIHRIGDPGFTYSATGFYEYSGPMTMNNYNRKMDNNGVLLISTDGGKTWYYNATTISQYALRLYDPAWKNNPSGENYDKFIHTADWLVANMEADGSYRSQVKNQFLSTTLLPGHVSGMTQGQVLSVLGRAYYLTNNEKYNKAGQRCLNFMVKMNTSADTSKQNGTMGTLKRFSILDPTLAKYANYIVSEEAIVNPQVYILNGNLYATLGLYDWTQLGGTSATRSVAKTAFDKCVASMEAMLPYYDFYGYSSYDLRQFTSNEKTRYTSSYAHGCHVTLLKQLYDVMGSKIFYDYYVRFKAYYDDPFYRQTTDMFKVKPETSGF